MELLNSGEPCLDEWLREHAATADTRNLSRTYVWVDDQNVVIAYYTLVGHMILHPDNTLPKKEARGLPGKIPAVLLARLALDASLHGRHLGGAVLWDALGEAVRANQHVASRYVLVDALNEKAAGFYQHHGFERIPGMLRLWRPLRDITADIEEGLA